MWGSLLALALVGSVNPVRLAATLLVGSQPRPLPHLFVYWVGSLTVGIPALVVPLLVLHVAPPFRSLSDSWAAPQSSPAVRWVQIGIGAIAILSSALITVSSLTYRREAARLTTTGEREPARVPNGKSSAELSIPAKVGDGPFPEDGSAIRRVLGRALKAWKRGSLWASWAIGLLMGPAPDVVLFALAIIVASGAAIGTQIVGAVAYVLGVLGVVEIILVSYLATPTKTQALLRRLHRWASAHRKKLLAAILLVAGLSMLSHGLGG